VGAKENRLLMLRLHGLQPMVNGQIDSDMRHRQRRQDDCEPIILPIRGREILPAMGDFT
jgi:hypothetical protein